jgi:iron-sulfur cluster repair protein YtfE (RIC family)
VTAFDDRPETAPGRAFFQELLWVHAAIRRDLETVRRLAADVTAGLAAGDVQAELKQLETNGPLWQLKLNCLGYCRFVHMHHGAEDRMLFPTLRQLDPSLEPVIDRLEADHRRVSDLLDAVETAAADLTERGGDGARSRVADGLDELAAHLLEHLDFEEQRAGPAIRRLRRL